MMCNENTVGGCRFEFKLSWPTLDQPETEQTWVQGTNPMTSGAVKNYQGINAPYTGAKWAGLERSTTTGVALIDGSVGTTWWWYAVGTSRAHNH